MTRGIGELAGLLLGRHVVNTVVVGVACATLAKSFYTVNGGQGAVIFDRFRGILSGTVGEGTKDLQMVNVTLRILSRPEVNSLSEIFKTLGGDYDEKVLPSIGNEVLKVVLSQFNADQLLTEHDRIATLMRDALVSRAKDFNILLEDVSIVDLSYGKEFAKAVEQKQVAQQEAERSKLVVLKTEHECKAAIIRAEGERECAKLISDATDGAGKGLIELRMIEAAKEKAAVMCRNGSVMYFPGNNNMVIDVNPSGPNPTRRGIRRKVNLQ